MVVFLAGFPDDTRSFDAVAPAFEGTHAVLKLALPGYEGAPISEKWGLSFKVLIEKMHDAVEAQPHGDLYLVAHDWGAYLGLLYADNYPTEVAKLALLDIGHQKMSDKQSLAEYVVGPTYQLFPGVVFCDGRDWPPARSRRSRTRCFPGRRSAHAITNRFCPLALWSGLWRRISRRATPTSCSGRTFCWAGPGCRRCRACRRCSSTARASAEARMRFHTDRSTQASDASTRTAPRADRRVAVRRARLRPFYAGAEAR